VAADNYCYSKKYRHVAKCRIIVAREAESSEVNRALRAESVSTGMVWGGPSVRHLLTHEIANCLAAFTPSIISHHAMQGAS
jgi:hypothetical protein